MLTLRGFSSGWAIVRRSNWIAIGLALLGLAGCDPSMGTAAESGVRDVGMPAASSNPLSSAPPYGVEVALDVSLLRAQGQPESGLVLVFLREPGNRMPMAVRQFTLREAPERLEFKAGGPVDNIEVVARYSPTGKIDRSPNDLESSAPTSFGHPISRVSLSLPSNGQTSSGEATSASSEVTVSVSLGDVEAFADMPADTVVFVSARAQSGAIPVAVKRLELADLPIAVTLTDADAMLPGRNLSAASGVTVTAHIAPHGTPSRNQGDYVSARMPVTGSEGPIELLVDERVE